MTRRGTSQPAMSPSLQQESARLARSWQRHESAMLRDYLVQDVEDPRLNVQSLLSRHWLTFALAGERFRALSDQELRFSAALNWLLQHKEDLGDADTRKGVLYALRQGADNADGIELPSFLRQAFNSLPTQAGGLPIPNYLEHALTEMRVDEGQARLPGPCLNLFSAAWRQALANEVPSGFRVLEPACGSANDYRFLDAFGLARLIDYTGLDLSEKNVTNARGLFPGARFQVGNVFELDLADRSTDVAFVHDLFEHLSREGIEAAMAEICRVTDGSLCLHFFNMEEIDEHIIRPVDDYHWNTLSMARMRELAGEHGFDGQVIHVGTYLRWRTGCPRTHNPNAYTFILGRR